MKWTIDQQKAIFQNGSDILVSAAAGSGKTAVLVERIIRKLLDSEHPMDIDRMLVVTFTEAAASEMKEKIIRALQNDGSMRANRQLRLAGSADITTIDSFCLRCVKNNFHNIGIDPDFGICDKAEAELLKEEACNELFDSLYKSENESEKERFISLTEMYSSNRNDYGLANLIIKIYGFIQTFPEPEKWLDEKAAMYDLSGDEVFDSIWARDIIKNVRETGKRYSFEFNRLLNDMARLFDEDMHISGMPESFPFTGADDASSWEKQWESVILAIKASKRLEDVCSGSKSPREMWQDAYNISSEILTKEYFPVRRICGKAAENKDLVIFNEKRRRTNEAFKNAAENLIGINAENLTAQFEELGGVISNVVWLVKKFCQVYAQLKGKRNVFEFSDIEHMTYSLFQNEDIQSEYRNKYDEILIDEYQDTNGLQDAIFTSISKNNIFMVGDLKQSIYRFRGGDPYIFKKKNADYAKDAGGVRIALSQNFRSRKEILASVNSVFGCVMSDMVGDVVYEGDERLSRDEDYYTDNGCNHKSEIHLIPIIKDSEDTAQTELTETSVEAAHIAKEIRNLVDGNYQIMCGTDGNGAPVYRDIKYRDITILAGSVRSISDIYTEELSKHGVPVYIESEGYFDRKEIRLMLSLLRLIDNRRRDIPLIAVMRSPIGGFTDDELAQIRLFSKDAQCFYDAVCAYEGINRVLYEKCGKFVKMLERWNGYIHYKSVAGLIWSLYEETGFYDFMGAFEGGEEAQANLRLLYERAKQYEDTGFKGLFNFIKYTERMENRGEDTGTAKIIGENHDVVRIMTIHKSKGLEFPVVFLAGAGKRMRKSGGTDEAGMINMHKDAGFGVKYIDPKKGYYSDTIAHSYVRDRNSAEQQSENIRRLYVALTRPKEKLIITAVMKFKDNDAYEMRLRSWKESVPDGKMNEEISLSANSFCDWLIPAALNNADNWEFKTVRANALYSSDIYDILNYKYPYEDCCRLPSKTTVSEIKQLNHKTVGTADYSMTKRPKFAQTAQEANVIGTAHHQIMAHINMKQGMDEEYIRYEIKRICDEGQVIGADEKNISVGFISDFFDGKLGKRMIAANEKGMLMREAPFEISVEASVYDSLIDEQSLCDDDKIIIQGAIDCYFEEEDGIVLIDYKTDRFRGSSENKEDIQKFIDEKTDTYKIQLKLYERAIETITRKKVKEKYLYLFSVSELVKINN